jgi:hypothetical protein
MKEFMFLIRNTGDSKDSMSPEILQEFLEKCEVYINKLKEDGKLIAAQPIEREGIFINGFVGEFRDVPINIKKPLWVGYYHILAADLEEAIVIAKQNPEFEYSKTASIEVRPVKVKEESTGFVYPKE